VKFEEIMAVVSDITKTDRQKSADIEAAFLKASRPSALTLQPQKARKARTVTPRPKSPASDALNGFAGHVDNTVSDAN